MTTLTTIDAFVTGGTGFIGRWLLPELTAQGQRVGVLLRENVNGQGRLTELSSWVDAHGGRGDLIRPLPGDLGVAGLGLGRDDLATARTARYVFHLGAAMSFGLAPEVAEQVNVAGSERVIELAETAPRLQRVVLLSGFQHRRSSRLSSSRYHDSKLDADARVRELVRVADIPLTTVHPAMVVGDSRNGETTQFWGWTDLVRSLHRGRLPILPGGQNHWMPIIAVDYLARFIARAPQRDDTVGGQYWLLDADTPSLATLMAVVADELGVRAPRLRVPVPLAALGLRAGLTRWTGIDAESLSFLSAESFPVADAQRVASALDLTMPDPIDLVRTTTRFLRASDFRSPTTKPAVLRN